MTGFRCAVRLVRLVLVAVWCSLVSLYICSVRLTSSRREQAQTQAQVKRRTLRKKTLN